MSELSSKNNQKIETSYSLLLSVCCNIQTNIDLVDTTSIGKEISLLEKIFLFDKI